MMGSLDKVKQLVFTCIDPNDADIYLFGSQANQSATSTSDIDIAILPKASLKPGAISLLKETLENSTIPQKVDVINLDHVSKTFKENILKQGILWKK